jgi:hypothetical protein
MNDEPPYTGPIRLGDVFEWCPYGTDGWPHAWARVKVVGLRSRGQDMPVLDAKNDDPEAEVVTETLAAGKYGRVGDRGSNDLSRFREACRKERSKPPPDHLHEARR